MMNAHDIVLSPARLLWRTRGRTWDYNYLVRPTEPPREGWHNVFCDIFPGDGTNLLDLDRRGIWARGYERVPYAAVATETGRLDRAARPIRHFFLLTGDPVIFQGWNSQWGRCLAAVLEPAFAAVYALERGDEERGEDFSARLLAAVAAHLPAELRLRGGPHAP